MYNLRPYQIEAVEAGAKFLTDKAEKGNGLMVLPTGSGKSLIIANLALRIGKPILIFQPSKEILEQNYKKLTSYGLVNCGIFSASAGRKQIGMVTFATIGSVVNVVNSFKGLFSYIIIDECHLVNPEEGMYKKVLTTLELKVLGLTATPYRLYSNSNGGILRFITRTNPRMFNKMIYQVPIKELVNRGYLANLQYFKLDMIGLQNLQVNSTGNDYTDKSLKNEYKRTKFKDNLQNIVTRLLRKGRRRILVFTKFTEEAELIASSLGNRAAFVSGETPKREREQILSDFKSGKIWVVCNVGVLTTGFDYPELDTIVVARPTRSLSLWYQIVGRAIRPCLHKEGWIVDLCGTYDRFGRVDDLEIIDEAELDGTPIKGKWAVYNGLRKLTNVYY